jgi:hypothetical protein
MTATNSHAMKRHQIHWDIPDYLYQWLSGKSGQRGVTMDQILNEALDRYAQREGMAFDITHTYTWQLCGALKVAETEPEYHLGEPGVTNYAEHVDDVLYRG